MKHYLENSFKSVLKDHNSWLLRFTLKYLPFILKGIYILAIVDDESKLLSEKFLRYSHTMSYWTYRRGSYRSEFIMFM